MAIVWRFLRPPLGRAVLFGPRGTGKSTWLQQQVPEAVRLDLLDLLDPAVLPRDQARPERLQERLDASVGPQVVVIDAVQTAPQLLDGGHGLVERRPDLRCVLTGSSARRLRHGAADLLGGRLVSAPMPPFMAAELGEACVLERALKTGLVPLIWQAPDPAATLAAYAGLDLQEEVPSEALVRQLGDCARFLEVIRDPTPVTATWRLWLVRPRSPVSERRAVVLPGAAADRWRALRAPRALAARPSTPEPPPAALARLDSVTRGAPLGLRSHPPHLIRVMPAQGSEPDPPGPERDLGNRNP